MSTPRLPLEGRVALVTGATQGIGLGIAERLANDGATVAINGRAMDDRMTAAVTATGGFPAPGDMADRESVDVMVERIERNVGAIDILVVNHAYMSMSPLVDHEPADWWKIVDTNLGGSLSLVQAVLPGMRRAGAGRIVLISSEWGITGWANATAYCASKAGMVSLTKSLGRELAPENILVNAVAPGVVDTPQLEVDARDAEVTRAEIIVEYADQIPLARVGQPSEVAAAVALLADPAMGSLVGQTLQVNGGKTRSRA